MKYQSLKQRWKTALESGVNLVEEIKIPFPEEKEYNAVKSMYLNKTIGNLLATLGSGLVGFGLESLQGLGRAARNIKTTQVENIVYFPGFCNSTTGEAVC